MQARVTRLDYCPDLLVSQITYTLTNAADHCTSFSHAAIHRYLRDERLSADQVVAEAIGLPEAREEVRYPLYTGAPITRALLERAASALHVPWNPS